MSLFQKPGAPTVQVGRAEPPPDREIATGERGIAAVLFACVLVLRLLYAWHFRIDSDEPQHLHVVWAWANGLLPYRDVFDNHAPLFQALSAPLFALLGVRPDIVLPMRLAMVPLFVLTIGCVWKITATLFSRRTALWTALIAACLPPYFFTAVEFRPDQLWTLLWLLVLTVLATGRATPGRAFVAGLLLGAAFSVSMKSSLLLAALAQGVLGTLLVARGGGAIPWRRLGKCAAAGLAGMAILPAMVVLFFVAHHAGMAMYYGIIQHNILPSHGSSRMALHSFVRWLAGGSVLLAATGACNRLAKPAAMRSRIAFVFLAAHFYLLTLVCFWPILTAEDYLPFFPAWMLSCGPALLWMAGCALGCRAPVAPAVLVLGELAWIVACQPPLRDETADKIGIVADALQLAEPGDFVMDSKGETIYHRRPFPYVLEKLTHERMQAGLIADTIPECLVATRTPLATITRMPRRACEFLAANYLPVAFRLFVPGKLLTGDWELYAFEVAVPGRYTLITRSGQPGGILDGTPFSGPRELAIGPHTFRKTDGAEPVALLWARAIEKGYSPFAEIKRDYRSEQD